MAIFGLMGNPGLGQFQIGINSIQRHAGIQAVEPDFTRVGVFSLPVVGAAINLDVSYILRYQHVFLHAGQGLVGQQFFAPVDALGGFGEHFDNQARMAAEIRLSISEVASTGRGNSMGGRFKRAISNSNQACGEMTRSRASRD